MHPQVTMPACIARTVWYQSASHPHYHVVRHSRGRLMGRTDMVCWISGGLGGRSSTNCEMTSHTPSTRKSHYSLPAASVSLLHATPQHRLLPNTPAASHRGGHGGRVPRAPYHALLHQNDNRQFVFGADF